MIGGVERKIPFFCLDLPHSDAGFVKAYPAERLEAFCDGHNAAFAFFGGVPRSILYDNTRLAVARIRGDGTRERTRGFAELQSHYLFLDRFGRPGKGNDKGKVEGLVGYARRNFLVPVPRADSFAALNAHLEARCRERQGARLRGHEETIGERLQRDLAALQARPAAPYEACERKAARVSAMSLVRFDRNDHSVPTAYGHRAVLVSGPVDEVVIACGAETIARHPRSYGREGFVFDPLHYLALLEHKAGALDQAAPLQGWGAACRSRSGRCAACWRRAWAWPARGICAGAAPIGGVPAGGGPRGRPGGAPARGDRLRRREAPGAVPDRAPAAAAGPGGLSLPAAGRGRDGFRGGLHGPARRDRPVSDVPQVLLAHHLKALRLPSFLREHDKLARRCAAEGVDHTGFLLRLAELELLDRERRMWSGASARRASRR